jgi:stage V sporulation protein G
MIDYCRVTDVRIRTITRDEKMKAIFSVASNEQFVIHDIRIIEGSKGLIMAMPSKRIPGGGFRDIAHPISSEFRSHLQQKVIEAYATELETAHQLKPCALSISEK